MISSASITTRLGGGRVSSSESLWRLRILCWIAVVVVLLVGNTNQLGVLVGVNALAASSPLPQSKPTTKTLLTNTNEKFIDRRSWILVTAKTAVGGGGLAFLLLGTGGRPGIANAAAASEQQVYGRCLDSCVKECTVLAPGEANKAYCKSSCEDYCKSSVEEGTPTGKNDVVRQDRS